MLLPPFPRLRPRKFRALLSGALLVGAAVLPTAVEAAPAYTRRAGWPTDL
jgi:hypothetical protein